MKKQMIFYHNASLFYCRILVGFLLYNAMRSFNDWRECGVVRGLMKCGFCPFSLLFADGCPFLSF